MMNKHKMSYNVFQSPYNTLTRTQIEQKIKTIGGKSPRRPIISQIMKNSSHPKQQQTKKQQKRKGRTSDKLRKKNQIY